MSRHIPDSVLAQHLRAVAQALAITRALAVFDLETTGINPERDRIVELTIARVEPGSLRCQTLYSLVNPGIPIPQEASAVHGIHDADVAESPRFAAIAPVAVRMFEGADLLGYNHRRFDVAMIAAECKAIGRANPCEGAHLVDAQLIYFKREPRDLTAALQFFCGETHTDAHGTSADVLATCRVLLGQLDRYPDLPRDVAGLDALGRDPSFIDRDGKFIWRGGKACVGFGRHQGVPLRQVDQGFLYWMLDKDFPSDAKEIAREALRGRYPVPPPTTEPAEALV